MTKKTGFGGSFDHPHYFGTVRKAEVEDRVVDAIQEIANGHGCRFEIDGEPDGGRVAGIVCEGVEPRRRDGTVQGVLDALAAAGLWPPPGQTMATGNGNVSG